MPAKTPKQQRFMAMCSSDAGRAKARGKCPPVAVAKEFRHLAPGAKKEKEKGK